MKPLTKSFRNVVNAPSTNSEERWKKSSKETKTPNLCTNDLCSGCASCFNVCPNDAISMNIDAKGFLTPSIDVKKCASCKLCEKACPRISPTELERIETPKVYACWSNNSEIRRQSSSGGMFSTYAKQILSEGGVVFGAVYDDLMKVVFAKAESIKDLTRFRTSKYVQAEVGKIYRDVKTELKSGRSVLFVGTPCQVGGLYGYLGTDHCNLYTCDLVCHGVPSPVLYKKWLEFLQKKLGGKIVSLNMRGKNETSSHLVVIKTDAQPNNTTVVDWEQDARSSYVGRMFMKNLCLRDSCAQCAFVKFPRIGDLTLGDFWSLGQNVPFDKPLDKGISLNIVNSEKGARLVERCQNEAVWIERSLEEAKAGNPNLSRSSQLHPKQKIFLRDVQKLSYRALIKKYRRTLEGSLAKRTRRRLHYALAYVVNFFLSLKR